MKKVLTLTEEFHSQIYEHLYPGDGLEAVAVCLCGRLNSDRVSKLTVAKVIPIPYEVCVRQDGLVRWPTEPIVEMIGEAAVKNMAILKIHSHPGGYRQFSSIDDAADAELFSSVFGWTETEGHHCSAVMLPSGEIFARNIDREGHFSNVDSIMLVGNKIRMWGSHSFLPTDQDLDLRNLQAFGEGTIKMLRGMSVAVIGCSGTGSPVIEQLKRLGIGSLILIDPDKIESKNLNRILNSNMGHAVGGVAKVDVQKEAIQALGFGTNIRAISANIYDSIDIIKEIAGADLIFGCVDSVDGRHLLNQIATFYCVPYIDLGVKLIADGKGGVNQIAGSVHYLIPGQSSLLTRRVYDGELLRAARLHRKNPTEYNDLRKTGYIANVNVDSPAVISVNLLVASLAVNEMLARIHDFRSDGNLGFATTRFSLTDGYFQFEEEGERDEYLRKYVGRGDIMPLLNMPELSEN